MSEKKCAWSLRNVKVKRTLVIENPKPADRISLLRKRFTSLKIWKQ